MGNIRFKVGDRVQIKSLDWYNENKDNYGSIYVGSGFCFWKNMARHCGEIMKITTVKVDPEDSNKGYYFMENSEEKWTDGMIEGLVEEETALNKGTGLKVELELSKSVIGVSNVESLRGERFMSGFVKAIIPPEGYQFVDENGNEILTSKIILEKKKKEYPKTYEECCYVLGFENTELVFEDDYRDINPPKEQWKRLGLMNQFYQLLICRDAYWKIAGEEMGLGKPWEPDFRGVTTSYVITVESNKILKSWTTKKQVILAFPTTEMRDAFYENFNELIEQCKELL